MNATRTNFPLLLIVLAVAAGLFAFGWHRIHIDTDIVASLPQNDPVIRDAVHIFENHPFQDQLTIDVGLANSDPDTLVACAAAVSAALKQTGLFKKVGMAQLAGDLPRLMQSVVTHLPLLFSADELKGEVAPLLTPQALERRVKTLQQQLLQMDGIGQATVIAQDPLGLKDLVLAKMIRLAPTRDARLFKGHLISADGRHLLVMATPKASGTDTTFARQLSDAMNQLTTGIEQQFARQGIDVTLTPVGAYRAALDNETIVRSDVSKAITFSSLGIALLLMVAFPRPLFGLLSLLPAVVGTLIAFFVFAMLRPSISVMVLGFGGAIISITVDHGIAYLLFLDRPQRSFGKQASREVWAVGLLAVLTTVGAFAALMISGFPVLQQLGLFSALGICFSFLFVHTVFPRIFPSLQAARDRRLPLPAIADRLFSFGPKGAFAAMGLFVVMLFFASPGFNIDLSAMNTVTPETRAAEKVLADAWGDIFSKVFVMTEGDSLADLQHRSDSLLSAFETAPSDQLRDQIFLPGMAYPGEARRQANLAAWKNFWDESRIRGVQTRLEAYGVEAGFRADAFEPFFKAAARPEEISATMTIPPSLYPLIGISVDQARGKWRQFVALTLPSDVSSEEFYEKYSGFAGIFDPQLFSDRLGHLMAGTFVRLLVIVGSAVVLLLLIFFLDVRLTLTALAPVIFAMVCTLGTLDLLGRSLDIPGLILAVVVLGMGIDYSLYMVRAYQRYGKADDPSFKLVRSAVLMTGTSTLIGFGVLAGADHALLNSAGVSASMGIGYSLIGVFLLMPPLLKLQFEGASKPVDPKADLPTRVSARYRRMETYSRQFAHYKMKLDPLFTELSERVTFSQKPLSLADIGTGYGVPACWLAETYPTAKIYGIEPDPDRVRVANRALGQQGEVICGLAPSMPPVPNGADGAFMLDMMHYLSDHDLMLTLQRLCNTLAHGAPLVMRCVMAPQHQGRLHAWIGAVHQRLGRVETHFRSDSQILSMVKQAGFTIEQFSPAGRRGDMLWVRAIKEDGVV